MHQIVIVQVTTILTKMIVVSNVVINVLNVKMVIRVAYVLSILIDIHLKIVIV